MKLVRMMLISSVLIILYLSTGIGFAEELIEDSSFSIRSNVLDVDLSPILDDLDFYNLDSSVVDYVSDVNFLMSHKLATNYIVGVKFIDFGVENNFRVKEDNSKLWLGLQFIF